MTEYLRINHKLSFSGRTVSLRFAREHENWIPEDHPKVLYDAFKSILSTFYETDELDTPEAENATRRTGWQP